MAPRSSRSVVLIPVLNEGERIRRQLAMMADTPGIPDVVIADGGSTDGSLDREWLERHKVRALLVKRGPGRVGAQLRIGFAWALLQQYEGIVTIDGNGKDGVDAIPSFVQALDEGWDFVQGSRFAKGGRAVRTPLSRLLAITVLHAPAVSLAAGFRYHDTTNGFRAYSRRLLLDPRVQPFRDVFTGYEILWYLAARAGRLGMRVKELPVSRSYPEKGPTPTKIHARTGFTIVGELLSLLRGAYDPPEAA
ncbi:MAG: glycosyltransferase family 2 protein [Vicinamibacterales bacterium]